LPEYKRDHFETNVYGGYEMTGCLSWELLQIKDMLLKNVVVTQKRTNKLNKKDIMWWQNGNPFLTD